MSPERVIRRRSPRGLDWNGSICRMHTIVPRWASSSTLRTYN